MDNYMLDKEFLKQLDLYPHKITYAKIIALNFDDEPIAQIEGEVTSGSINIDGSSAVRRTCSLTMVTDDLNVNNYKWGLKTKVKIYIGLNNEIDQQYDDVIWFNQGIYIITSFSASYNTTSYTISLQASDKMCLLNGSIGGILPASIDFKTTTFYENKYDEISFGEQFNPNGLQYSNEGEYKIDGIPFVQSHKFFAQFTHEELAEKSHEKLCGVDNSSFDINKVYYVNPDDYKKTITEEVEDEQGNKTTKTTEIIIGKNKVANLNKFTYSPGKYYIYEPKRNVHKHLEYKDKTHAELSAFTNEQLFGEYSLKAVEAGAPYDSNLHYFRDAYSEVGTFDAEYEPNKYYTYDRINGYYLSTGYSSGEDYYTKEEYYPVENLSQTNYNNGVYYEYDPIKKEYTLSQYNYAGDGRVTYYIKKTPEYKLVNLFNNSEEYYLESGDGYIKSTDTKYDNNKKYFKKTLKEVIFTGDGYQAGKYYVYDSVNQYKISNDPYDPSRQYYVKSPTTITSKDVPIKELVREAVHTFAKEPYHNIIINDVEDYQLKIMEYRGDNPIYVLLKDGVSEDMKITYGGENVICYILKDSIDMNQFELLKERFLTVLSFLDSREDELGQSYEEKIEAAKQQFISQVAINLRNGEGDNPDTEGLGPETYTADPYYILYQIFSYDELESLNLTYNDLENYLDFLYNRGGVLDESNGTQFNLDSSFIKYDTLIDDFNIDPSRVIFDSQICVYDDQDGWNDFSYYTIAKIEYGDAAGFALQDFVYPDELVSGIGDSLTTILDKIKEQFSMFEYFYDVDGHFVFQKKKTYTSTSWNNIVASITDNINEDGEYVTQDATYVDNTISTSAAQYSFENNKLIISLSYNPKLDNLKNDYSVWGTKKNANGSEIPIHMRYAIDKKPTQYISFPEAVFHSANAANNVVDHWELTTVEEDGGFNIKFLVQDVYFTRDSDLVPENVREMTNEEIEFYFGDKDPNVDGYYTYTGEIGVVNPIKWKLNDEDEEEQEIYGGIYYRYHLCDWREIIYQMSKDYYRYNQRDDFTVKLAEFNPDTCANGYTGYEQYYVDIYSFWRDLYDENPEVQFGSFGGFDGTCYDYVVTTKEVTSKDGTKHTEIEDIKVNEYQGWNDYEIDYSDITCNYFLPLEKKSEYLNKAIQLRDKYATEATELEEYKEFFESKIADYKAIIYVQQENINKANKKIAEIQKEKEESDLESLQAQRSELKGKIRSATKSKESAISGLKMQVASTLIELGFNI